MASPVLASLRGVGVPMNCISCAKFVHIAKKCALCFQHDLFTIAYICNGCVRNNSERAQREAVCAWKCKNIFTSRNSLSLPSGTGLPPSQSAGSEGVPRIAGRAGSIGGRACSVARRSEEHTSELQSLRHLVCRLL